MPEMNIEELNQIYDEADRDDYELFAEQRSNVLLVSGEHYTRKNSRFWSRIRDNKDLTNEQRLRLTKNHVGRITKIFKNAILTHSPGVTLLPNNESELADQKAAELHKSVWEDIKRRSNFKQKTREWVSDFIDIGECASKIFFDPNKGPVIGYSPVTEPNPETGEPTPVIDPSTGQMKPDMDSPILSGEIIFERVFGFNLLRDTAAKSWGDARHRIYRKMIDKKELQKLVGDDEEKLKFISESSKDVYTIFDANNGSYFKTKNMVMLREFYFEPNSEYRNGYYVLATDLGKLFEGEIPFGIYPLEYEGFDEIPTTPRHRSIIKQIRPYQYEINRAASQIATHQITLGDDKLLIQTGTKIAPGGTLPGVRAITYAGMPPSVLSGRSGEQYLNYMQSQIAEMYQVAGIEEEIAEKQPNTLDPYAMLYQSLRNKRKFSFYAEKFEDFLVRNVEKGLRLAKHYYNENALVPAIGKRETINIAEFKSSDDLGYQIKIQPQVDDVETKMGKQLVLNNLVQYVGPQMQKDDIGKLMRSMPYVNQEKMLEDFTQDYDNLVNDILALDRGESRPANNYDNHNYVIRGLIHRMKQADFNQLQPQIQQLYQQKLMQHESIEVDQQKKIQAAKDGFIPTGGFMVAMDFYVPNADDPTKTRRARVPSEAVNWLMEKLDTQGTTQDLIAQHEQSAQADMANMHLEGQGQVLPFPR